MPTMRGRLRSTTGSALRGMTLCGRQMGPWGNLQKIVAFATTEGSAQGARNLVGGRQAVSVEATEHKMNSRLKVLFPLFVWCYAPGWPSSAGEAIDGTVQGLRGGGKDSAFLNAFLKHYPSASNARIRNLRQPDSDEICGEYSADKAGWRPFCISAWGGGTF
jgi:hypothetical protein